MSEQIVMRDADSYVLRDYVVQCTRDTFAAYCIDIELNEGDACEVANESQVVAFIGFGGRRVRGTLTVMAPQTLWRRTYPIPCDPGTEAALNDILDWGGEVVNQILGRIKNQLMRRGVELQVSTPKAMHASQLTISKSAQKSVCMLRSRRWKDAAIGVWFDAVVEDVGPLFAPLVEEEMDAGAPSEGELVLF